MSIPCFTAVQIGCYLYVAGGRTVEDTLITSVERYDPINDEWTHVYEWANATSDGAAFVSNDLIYLIGGYDQPYNAIGNVTVLNVTSWEETYNVPPIPTPRGDLAVSTLNGKGHSVV